MSSIKLTSSGGTKSQREQRRRPALDVDIHDEDAMFQMGMSYGQMAGVHGWKDLNLRYLFVSEYTAKIFGYDHLEDLIGGQLCIADVHCRASELSGLFDDEDYWVLQEKKPMLKLEYLCFVGNQWKVMLGTKYPVLNRQGEAIAVGMAIQDITDTHLAILNYDVLCSKRSRRYGGVKQFSYVIDGKMGDVCLTDRQQEVMFYLLRGHTAKSIAARLGVGDRTVQDHIGVLKSKFGCFSKQQLIEKLLALGYLNVLPQTCVQYGPLQPVVGVGEQHV